MIGSAWRPGGPRKLVIAAMAGLAVLATAACSGSGGDPNAVELLNVSYDPTRELYDEINPRFAARWKEQTGQTLRRVGRGDVDRARAIPVEHPEGGVAVLPVLEQRIALLRLHLRRTVPLDLLEQYPGQAMLAHQRVVGGIAEAAHVLARGPLLLIGVEQLLEDRRMRRVGDHRAHHAPVHLPGQGRAPGDRAAPVVADDREPVDAQRIGEQEHIADQLVGGIGVDLLRFRRPAITALVGRHAAVAAREVRDLVAPGAVALGKAVEEDEDRCIARTDVHDIECDPVG
ncbi:hypothetical protein J4558_01320 [Leptolyngbya sp. 15MV]|nr:hypothetical protein J4558_01320 [Leptolyngbya sp. 15MV]